MTLLRDKYVDDLFKRLRTAVLKRHTAASIAKYIVENTTIGMQPYSFKDHEFQEAIISDMAVETNTQKCSQVGISEVSTRKALGLVTVLQPYTVAYTLPSARFATKFMRTRVDPVIKGSPDMLAKVSKANDNMEFKQIGDSFFHLLGAGPGNDPISIPVDHLIHDEVDFSDQATLGKYVSRLTHSPWKRIDRFSTPTLPNFGINKFFRESRRHYLMCKCHHCNHWFVPDYYEHVKIPGFTGDLHTVTKHTLSSIKWQEAVLRCPRCGDVPSLQWGQREWVCENPSENYVGVGRQVSPFDAPNIITASDLVKASTGYARIQDFINFNLGLPAEDKEATLTREDFVNRFYIFELGSDFQYVMGVDVGSTYHFVVLGINGSGHSFVVHREAVPMGKARDRYDELRAKYRPITSVIDSMPHAETVMAMQAKDVNLYAAVYTRSKSLLTHTVVQKDDVKDEGKKFVRQVNINRDRAFDAYMGAIRAGEVHWQEGADKDEIIEHHMSMKRVKVYDSVSDELTYSWQKTDGVDHYHHAHLFAWIAGQIRGIGRPEIIIPTTTIFTFKNKQNY